MNKDKKGCNVVLGILIAIIVIYLLYLLLIWLAKVFVYWGYNFFFFLDNLFFITYFDPIAVWALFGLLIGSFIGIMIAIKKLKLNAFLLLYPSVTIVLFTTIMGFINKPTEFYGSYAPPVNIETVGYPQPEPLLQKDFYTLKTMVNVRSGPNIKYPKVLVLNKGTEVELIQKGYYTQKNVEWFKIKYKDQEGYVNSKYLNYTRSNN